MKAWIIASLTGIGALKQTELREPQPTEGEVVLKVEYAALNPADRYLAEGAYPAKPPMPHVLGRDGAGEIIAVGEDAGNWKVGDRALILRGDVGVSRAGTFAEKVSVPVDSLMPVPKGWSMEEASGASLIYLTAHQALSMWGELTPSPGTPDFGELSRTGQGRGEGRTNSGPVVLITGASGGVGIASLQLGRAMGCRVICLSRSREKQKKLLELGAEICFDPADPNWPKELKRHLADKRVDLVIDNVGGAGLNDAIDTLGMNGKISCVGRLAGPVPNFNTASLFFRRIRVGGVAAASYSRPEAQATWLECLKLLEKIGARPIVDRVFEFEQLPAAFEYLARGPMGKVLLRCG